jgi:hypothetical protein
MTTDTEFPHTEFPEFLDTGKIGVTSFIAQNQ